MQQDEHKKERRITTALPTNNIETTITIVLLLCSRLSIPG